LFKLSNYLSNFIAEYSDLRNLQEDIKDSFNLIESSFKNEGTLFTCGNGGSASDSEHIVGELMKSFVFDRPIPNEDQKRFIKLFPKDSKKIINNLESPFRAISLMSETSFSTAFANDISYEFAAAQKLYALGKPKDILLAISTSGNSENIIRACQVAKMKNIKVIGLTGSRGGKLKKIADVCISVPSDKTHKIQEYHLPIYHFLCYALEASFFDNEKQHYELIRGDVIKKKPLHIFFDFDGVLTDNKVYLTQEGTESVMCDRSDGLGIKLIKEMGIEIHILSTETNKVVSERSKKLGVECFQSCPDKLKFLKQFCKDNKISSSQIGFVGNDINDKEAIEFSEISFCPSDSDPVILSLSDYVLTTKGGKGVAKEIAGLLSDIYPNE